MISAVVLLLTWVPAPSTDRPHDPWVFRSVLDRRARIVTVALDDELWVAWDATGCTLHRAWKGGVHFDGAVYTTIHGPQPTSDGWIYGEGGGPDLWELTRPDGETVVGTPRYRGYTLSDDDVTFAYELRFPDGTTIDVRETPRVRRQALDDGTERLELERGFTVAGAPVPGRLTLHVRESWLPADGGDELDAWSWSDADARARAYPDREAVLSVTASDTASWIVPCRRISDEALQAARADEEERKEQEALEAEARAEEEERAADEEEAQAMNDAADDEGVAATYDASDGDATDAGAIDAESDDAADAGTADADAAGPTEPEHPAVVPLADDPGPREPGLALRLYDIDRSMAAIPTLVAGQTPNVSRVVPVLDLEDDDFDIEDHFVTVVSGFLEVAEDGVHEFRLTSDDGSALWIGATEVIRHDGLHGPTPEDGSVALTAGLYPLLVHHFENGGGQELTLEWRPPSAARLQVVPTSALSCPQGEVRVTSPGTKDIVRPLRRSTPGLGEPLAGVHPSFDLSSVRPASWEPKVGGMDWLSDGRLVVCTWDPEGAVWILDGVTDDPESIVRWRFAAGLAEPLGLSVVDDRIFVLQKQELTELVDHDGDGVADEYRCVSSGWDVTPNFHEFAFGLVHHDGAFWANLAVAIEPGGASSPAQPFDRGSTIRIDPATGGYEIVARGLRTPNGIGFGYGGEIYLTDNQGDWLPCSKLLHLQPGAFYGCRSVLLDAADGLRDTPPVAWLPQGEIGNSPGEPAPLPDGNGPYSGQMIYCDVTHGGVKRVFVEEVDGQLQGCVFRFTQGLEAGINRLSWGPDGGLYVGGIGSTGNWGQTGKQRFGLQRLAYNGEPTFEMLAVRALANGMEIELTEPVDDPLAWEPRAYEVTQWRYEPTSAYGGPKLDLTELTVASASVSADGRRVFLELPGLRAGHVVHVAIPVPLASTGGRRLWTNEAWYTLNRVPTDLRGTVRARPARPPQNVLTAAERAAGWELLFDGATTRGWRGYGSDGMPDGWRVENGCLARVDLGGDIITEETFEDFELSLEWRLERGGNSGIFFHVAEGLGAVWQTGPEMQVLDNLVHGDGLDPRTSAGANYALHAPTRDATRPTGLFNRARIRVVDGKVEHWLNGVALCEYQLGSDDWEERVAASKFADLPRYGREGRGHIALQDHGDPVWYRNVKIRRLGPE